MSEVNLDKLDELISFGDTKSPELIADDGNKPSSVPQFDDGKLEFSKSIPIKEVERSEYEIRQEKINKLFDAISFEKKKDWLKKTLIQGEPWELRIPLFDDSLLSDDSCFLTFRANTTDFIRKLYFLEYCLDTYFHGDASMLKIYLAHISFCNQLVLWNNIELPKMPELDEKLLEKNHRKKRKWYYKFTKIYRTVRLCVKWVDSMSDKITLNQQSILGDGLTTFNSIEAMFLHQVKSGNFLKTGR